MEKCNINVCWKRDFRKVDLKNVVRKKKNNDETVFEINEQKLNKTPCPDIGNYA